MGEASSCPRVTLYITKLGWIPRFRDYVGPIRERTAERGFAQKVATLICFLCGLCVSLRPLRISAALCVERPINAENAEIRRGPQRKDFHLNSIFCAKPRSAVNFRALML